MKNNMSATKKSCKPPNVWIRSYTVKGYCRKGSKGSKGSKNKQKAPRKKKTRTRSNLPPQPKRSTPRPSIVEERPPPIRPPGRGQYLESLKKSSESKKSPPVRPPGRGQYLESLKRKAEESKITSILGDNFHPEEHMPTHYKNPQPYDVPMDPYQIPGQDPFSVPGLDPFVDDFFEDPENDTKEVVGDLAPTHDTDAEFKGLHPSLVDGKHVSTNDEYKHTTGVEFEDYEHLYEIKKILRQTKSKPHSRKNELLIARYTRIVDIIADEMSRRGYDPNDPLLDMSFFEADEPSEEEKTPIEDEVSKKIRNKPLYPVQRKKETPMSKYLEPLPKDELKDELKQYLPPELADLVEGYAPANARRDDDYYYTKGDEKRDYKGFYYLKRHYISIQRRVAGYMRTAVQNPQMQTKLNNGLRSLGFTREGMLATIQEMKDRNYNPEKDLANYDDYMDNEFFWMLG